MPRFHYTATDASGAAVDGFIDAASADEAAALLQRRELRVNTLRQTASDASAGSDDVPSDSRDHSPHADAVHRRGPAGSGDGKVEPERELPLSVGLRTLSEESVNRSLRRTFARMSEELENGQPLEDVVARCRGTMPDWLAHMIHSGTESGTLTRSVAHYVHFTRLRNRLRGRVITALLYPGIMLSLLVLISIGMFGFLLPQFKNIYEGFGVELPPLTLLLIDISDLFVFFLTHAVITVPVTVLLCGGGIVMLRALAGPALTRRVAYEIPLLGRIIKLTGLSEFCHLLALLIENRVPLPQALMLVATAMRDPCLSQCAEDASRLVEQGLSPASLQARVANMPVELVRVPGWGHPDESLPQSLRSSGEIFAAQCDVNARAMAGAATPVVVLTVGILAIVTLVGLFMPLIKLLNDLS